MSERDASAPDLKYERGASPLNSRSRPLGRLELATVLHLGAFALAVTWAFGGNAVSVRQPLTWWGTLGALITVAALLHPDAAKKGRWKTARWLLPLAFFDLLVVVGSFNPSFRLLTMDGQSMLANVGAVPFLPTSVVPAEALRALWTFNVVWLSCFNLALIVRRRRALRALLLVLVINALVLAVFGTAQKLTGATGLYFGAVPSPQRSFFSTFVYHNHWGSFMVLMLGACLGLAWHYARTSKWRDFLHSPAPAAIVAVLLMAASIPLSTSRSCSLLAALLLAAAFAHWIVTIIRRRRHYRESIVLPIGGSALVVAAVVASSWYLARDSIRQRTADTQQQVSTMVARGSIGGRADLYGDTWRMAQDKPWFGWGMASYPRVFAPFYNGQKSVDGLPMHFNDAHSDWLQSLAEHGFIGSALLAACALVPLYAVRRQLVGVLRRYLLLTCGLVLAYAWIEFPFGNLAVVLHWWLLFFAAIQYARLQSTESPGRPSNSPWATG